MTRKRRPANVRAGASKTRKARPAKASTPAISRNDFGRRREAKMEMVPSAGFNLVGVDTFEWDPGAELYFIAHFETREEAEKAQKERNNPFERTYIYEPDTR